jgi:hypothetical protein
VKTCKICGDQFKAYKTTQRVCSYDCAIEYAKHKRQKDELKKWNQRKKELKKNLETLTQLAVKVQKTVNEYVRLRDAGKPCVSCGIKYASNFQAGHLYPSGTCWSVRFDPRNIHVQCRQCNMNKSGNLNEYRKNVLSRITERDLKELDALAHQTAHFTKHDLHKIKSDFEARIDEIKKK